MKPGFITLNLNQTFKANNGNTLVLHIPNKFNEVVSVGKMMTSAFFCYSENLNMIDYLEKGEAMIGLQYASELRLLNDITKSKCRRMLKTHVLLHLVNAPAQTAQFAVGEVLNFLLILFTQQT